MAQGIHRRGIFVAFLAALAGITAPVEAEIRYTVMDLGTLGGTESWAYGINNAGQVVGRSDIIVGSSYDYHAFRTEPNQPINPASDDLGTLGGANSVAYGINDGGAGRRVFTPRGLLPPRLPHRA